MVSKDIKVIEEIMDLKEKKDTRELMESKDLKVTEVIPERKDPSDPLE